jgi:hypothetical protein
MEFKIVLALLSELGVAESTPPDEGKQTGRTPEEGETDVA